MATVYSSFSFLDTLPLKIIFTCFTTVDCGGGAGGRGREGGGGRERERERERELVGVGLWLGWVFRA
jgi:hypothetical protein